MAASALFVCLVIGFTIWATVTRQPDPQGIGTFTFGNCATIDVWNKAVHVVLNIIASLFLGAGNYCAQILVAPTRTEIDNVHRKGGYLDVGVPSIRNLLHLRWWRPLLWLLIGLLACSFHLL
jgi:hypothetical protein